MSRCARRSRGTRRGFEAAKLGFACGSPPAYRSTGTGRLAVSKANPSTCAMKKAGHCPAFCLEWRDPYAAASQYPALKGLDMRSASGETSTSLSVGIFSPVSVAGACSAPWASFARSAWPCCAERATEKNRRPGMGLFSRPSIRPCRGRCRAAARGLPCRISHWRGSTPARR